MNREKLKNSIKKIANWTCSPRLQRIIRNSAYHIRGVCFRESWVTREIQKNIEYKDKHKGKRCFILCTGPSIKKQDLKPLKDEFCIAVSMFALHQDYKIINPNYHVMAPWHTPFLFDDMEKKFIAISETRCKDTIIFLGHYPYKYSYYNYFLKNSKYKPENIRYINYGGSTQIDMYNYDKRSMWDLTIRPFLPSTVLYSAIQLAAYMGFEEIYLLGADQNYFEYIDQQYSSNFYPDVNRVDDSCVWRSVWRSTENMFYIYHTRWQQFGLMKKYLNSKNIAIYNATKGGMLDVFPRVKYDDVINSSNKFSDATQK